MPNFARANDPVGYADYAGRCDGWRDVCLFHLFRGTGGRKFVHTFLCNNRAIFLWPWNKNARTKQKQEKNLNRAIWLVYRTDTNALGFWLIKRTQGWKYSMPEIFLEINRYFALTLYCNTIGQTNNAFSILGCLWPENEEAMFWYFHPLADKTNNEHLPKPFFKVIKSL